MQRILYVADDRESPELKLRLDWNERQVSGKVDALQKVLNPQP